ncbi:MAG: class I SAM-dependent methyltransferase [Algoriphagus sp.]|uniref:class I SAM-dependent methyltransferase n=1 Tax=Algoriphagus sp. TaxID=1872435 RepID=UPI002612808E|nr:class I SAM-dependent methyltransferase [Algoriphagus sp.]MDG1278881.1 class I SAM-dependent methyltransferase [Algoriphagus sp.]
MRQIICPVCNSIPTDPLEDFEICTCSNCKVDWTYLPNSIESEELYQDEVYRVVDNRKSIFERIIFSEARKILSKAKQLLPQAKTLLDFGSGKGQFLWVAKESVWKGTGIETAAERADFASEFYQVKVIRDFYSKGKVEAAPFDFITLNHVLEHLPQPILLLNELLDSNLAKDGLVYIEVPRANSWQAKIAAKNWMHWDIPKHLTHWTEPVLLNEMSKIGFSKKADRRFSIHLGLMGMVQSIMSIFGFRDNLVLRLKRKKTFGLLLGIGLVLPIAFLIELLAVIFKRSGIIGVYFKSND